MLTLTENARTIVKDISTQPGLPDTAGLRITSEDSTETSFAISAAASALPGDQVVVEEGATIYLDEASAAVLDDKVLDAAVEPGGSVEFGLSLQG